MKQNRILDLPLEIVHHIFSYLNIHNLHRLNQVCKSWRNASQSLYYLDCEGLRCFRYVQELPQRHPQLKYVNICVWEDEDVSLEPWAEDYASLRGISTDNLRVAALSMQCPKLEMFQFKRDIDFPVSEDYMFSELSRISTDLIRRVSSLDIEMTGENPDFRDLFHENSLSCVNSSIIAENLTTLKLQIRNQSLTSLFNFFSKCRFPHVANLSLSELEEASDSDGIKWPDFVSNFPRWFPCLRDLEINHQFSDIVEYLPKNLIGLQWCFCLIGGTETPVSLSQILDQRPHLERLSVSKSWDTSIADDLQKNLYPQVTELDIDNLPTRFHLFPNLRVLEISMRNKDMDVFFEDMKCYCPQIETLQLTEIRTFRLNENQDSISIEEPWLPTLKHFVLFAQYVDYQSFACLITKHKLLQKIKLNSGNFTTSSETDLTRKYTPLANLRDFSIAIRQTSEEARAIIGLASESRHLQSVAINQSTWRRTKDWSSVSIDLPTIWPRLNCLVFERIVTGEQLQTWSENSFWPQQLEKLDLLVYNTVATWAALIRVLETHSRLESFQITWIEREESYDPIDLDQTRWVNEQLWNRPHSNDKEALQRWKTKVMSATQTELAQVFFRQLMQFRTYTSIFCLTPGPTQILRQRLGSHTNLDIIRITFRDKFLV